MELYEYTAPDFYAPFLCKCGECRHSCCKGWNVSISEKEYFRLIGIDCSEQLRRRLDEAFFVPHDASPERYALLNHNYLGDCPLRLESGLCALQREKGESALPAVCKLYPRSIDPALAEATLANSCEAVLEGFICREAPITFETVMLPERPTSRESEERLKVRKRCIALLQDRRLAVRYRIASIGDMLQTAHAKRIPFSKRLAALIELENIYGEISPSIGEYCNYAHDALSSCAQSDYARLALNHDSRFPELKFIIEHSLVNHMFYEKFPYTLQADNTGDAFASLCGVYGFLRLICVGNSKRLNTKQELIDVLSAAFRVVEHTRFDRNVDAVLGKLGYGMDDADALLML